MDRPRVAVKTKPVPAFIVVSAILAVMIIFSAASMVSTNAANEYDAPYTLESP